MSHVGNDVCVCAVRVRVCVRVDAGRESEWGLRAVRRSASLTHNRQSARPKRIVA